MTAFIRQEALEKAKEIELKADEEFAIEKAKLVRQETAAVARAYDKKFKQAAMSQQITRSTLANRSRLRLLAARQALLDDLFERVRARLVEEVARSSSSSNGSSGGDSGDSGEGGEGGDEGDKGGDEGGEGGESGEAGGRYIGVLKNLVLQGAYALNEPRLMVQARKQDYDAVRRAIRDAEKEYGDVAGREIHIDVDEDNPLPPSRFVLFFPYISPPPFLFYLVGVSFLWN